MYTDQNKYHYNHLFGKEKKMENNWANCLADYTTAVWEF